MRIKKLGVILGLAVLLTGCGAGGAKFSGLEKPSDNMAKVYIYRTSSFVQSGNFPDLALDGKEIGQLKNGGYLAFPATAGKHQLDITGNVMQWIHRDASTTLEFEAGKTYFYKLSVSMGGPSSGGINVGFGQSHSFGFQQITDKQVALADLKELNESK